MPIRLLIIDPDLQLTSRLKPAIETAGDFIVRVCATGSAALGIVQHEPQDVAVIDFDVVGMPDLVTWLRDVQPGLYILVTPRTSHQAAQIPKLNVQGSVTKPYFARQIVPVIIEAAAARQRFELLKDRKSTATILEAPIKPDDTFSRMAKAATADTTQKKAEVKPELTAATITAAEPPIPDEATIGELVSGQTSRLHPVAEPPRDDATFVSPPSLPEESEPAAPSNEIVEPIIEPDSPSVAMKALEVSVDDTPLDNVSVQTVVELVNTEIVAAGTTQPAAPPQPIPMWAQPEPTAAPPAATITPTLKAPKPKPAIIPSSDPAERVAQMAAQLTQLAVDSSARGILISKGDFLIAAAGPLSTDVMADALAAIRAVWNKQQPTTTGDVEAAKPLISYVTVPGTGDFLLFSAHTVEDMTLSLLFAPETSIKTMRRQAKGLITALSAVPDPDPQPEPVAIVEAPAPQIEQQPATAPESIESIALTETAPLAPTAPIVPAVQSAPMMSYGFVWLPSSGELFEPLVETIYELLPAVATEHGWEIDELDLRAACVSVQVNVPTNANPTQVVETLMHITAEHVGDDDLWADSYYIIPAERLATDQEIAGFLEFHRDAFQPNRH